MTIGAYIALEGDYATHDAVRDHLHDKGFPKDTLKWRNRVTRRSDQGLEVYGEGIEVSYSSQVIVYTLDGEEWAVCYDH